MSFSHSAWRQIIQAIDGHRPWSWTFSTPLTKAVPYKESFNLISTAKTMHLRWYVSVKHSYVTCQISVCMCVFLCTCACMYEHLSAVSSGIQSLGKLCLCSTLCLSLASLTVRLFVLCVAFTVIRYTHSACTTPFLSLLGSFSVKLELAQTRFPNTET